MLSDLYAMGVSECDNMLMLLGVSEQLTNSQRKVVTPLVIQGFNGVCVLHACVLLLHNNYAALSLDYVHNMLILNFKGLSLFQFWYNLCQTCVSIPMLPFALCVSDLCVEAGTSCNGGQSVINPWFIIGGVASSVCLKSEFIM